MLSREMNSYLNKENTDKENNSKNLDDCEAFMIKQGIIDQVTRSDTPDNHSDSLNGHGKMGKKG